MADIEAKPFEISAEQQMILELASNEAKVPQDEFARRALTTAIACGRIIIYNELEGQSRTSVYLIDDRNGGMPESYRFRDEVSARQQRNVPLPEVADPFLSDERTVLPIENSLANSFYQIAYLWDAQAEILFDEALHFQLMLEKAREENLRAIIIPVGSKGIPIPTTFEGEFL